MALLAVGGSRKGFRDICLLESLFGEVADSGEKVTGDGDAARRNGLLEPKFNDNVGAVPGGALRSAEKQG